MQAKKSEDEGKASELAQQLAELKAQRAAAYSRNLALEKVFELRKLLGNDKSQGSGGSGWLSSDPKQANASISAEPAQYSRSNPIHLSVDVDTLARRLGGQQLSPPMARISTVQLENLELADFARLWKEYISRCRIHVCVGMKQQACTVALQGKALVKPRISLQYCFAFFKLPSPCLIAGTDGCCREACHCALLQTCCACVEA